MKVVHVNTSTGGGAGIAALRLHRAQRELGMHSAFISNSLTIDFGGNKMDDPMFEYKRKPILQRFINKIERIMNPTEAQKLEGELRDLQNELNYEVLSLPYSETRLEEHPLIMEADVVHLHWVGGILDYDRFFTNINKPLVWTLHDMNPFKGIFHYSTDEDQNESARELDDRVKGVKRNAIAKVSNAALVSPSQWLLEEARSSAVFDSFGMKRTVANCIDTNRVEQADREAARKVLGLGPSEKVMLFTAAQLNVPRKGIDLLTEALSRMGQRVTVLTMGKGAMSIENKEVKVIPLGYMTDEAEIASAYAAADVFVLPSREDNLPNTMLEALSAGTPVVGFDIGGIGEHITTGETGILVGEISEDGLLQALTDFCNDTYEFDRQAIKRYATEKFNPKIQAKSYQEIYETLLTKEEL